MKRIRNGMIVNFRKTTRSKFQHEPWRVVFVHDTGFVELRRRIPNGVAYRTMHVLNVRKAP